MTDSKALVVCWCFCIKTSARTGCVASARTGHQRESELASTASVRGSNVIWQQSFGSILLEAYRVYWEFGYWLIWMLYSSSRKRSLIQISKSLRCEKYWPYDLLLGHSSPASVRQVDCRSKESPRGFAPCFGCFLQSIWSLWACWCLFSVLSRICLCKHAQWFEHIVLECSRM